MSAEANFLLVYQGKCSEKFITLLFFPETEREIFTIYLYQSLSQLPNPLLFHSDCRLSGFPRQAITGRSKEGQWRPWPNYNSTFTSMENSIHCSKDPAIVQNFVFGKSNIASVVKLHTRPESGFMFDKALNPLVVCHPRRRWEPEFPLTWQSRQNTKSIKV